MRIANASQAIPPNAIPNKAPPERCPSVCPAGRRSGVSPRRRGGPCKVEPVGTRLDATTLRCAVSARLASIGGPAQGADQEGSASRTHRASGTGYLNLTRDAARSATYRPRRSAVIDTLDLGFVRSATNGVGRLRNHQRPLIGGRPATTARLARASRRGNIPTGWRPSVPNPEAPSSPRSHGCVG